MTYEHKRIEEKWRKRWKDDGTYRVENDPSKPKYYVLDMFPYPSGAGLHVGHPLGYIASDIVARYKRNKGFNVLHPMGYDSFGLPAEQYAIQTGQHPAKTTEVNIARYREQFENIGFSFDRSREFLTSDPSYYKWTQWIFLQLFDSWYDHAQDKARPIAELIARFAKHGWNGADDSAITGNEELDPLVEFSHADWHTFSEKHQQAILLRFRLAYLSEAWVNWCPALGTVLANDEVKDGVSERGGHPVERKRMPQWSMRITAYAQRLLDGLNTLDWSESIKEAQRNWIGKSEGALIKFYLTPNPSPEERGTHSDERSSDHFRMTTDPGTWGKLIGYAKSMRHTATEAEEKLWQEIRGNATGGRIRRQHIIDNYIVDFVSLPKQLVIEVDGDIHDLQKAEDDARTLRLQELGFEVIRFRNEEVIQDAVEVKRKIIAALGSRPDFARSDDLADNEEAHFPLSSGEGPGVRSEERAGGEVIEVFTTRPDTLFGVAFVTLAPEHELIERITPPERMDEVMAYVTQAKNRSERDRMADVKKVSGVFTGAYVKHPFTHLEIPVWVGDYVLGGYGTGAVMAVPAGDQRDWNFATHFDIPFVPVTEGCDVSKGADESKEATLTNSSFLNGMKVADAIPRAIEEIEAKGVGERRINFRLRDAAFGRQRYWGEPIPIYYKEGTPYAVPESELPLKLPEIDKYQPTESGEPPLARAANWTYQGHPLETTTMPGWAGSSWYFLRYMDPGNTQRFASPEAISYWKQVDLYVGGSEHATGHLLYFRFWTKFLNDRGWIDFDEPAKKLVNQGMIQGVSAMAYVASVTNFLIEGDGKRRDLIIRTNEGKSRVVPDFHGVRRLFISADVMGRVIQTEPGLTNPGAHAQLHLDVNYLDGGVVDFKRFMLRETRADVLNGIFATEDGCWIDGVFHPYVNGVSDGERKFMTSAEVEKMSKSKLNVVNPDDIIERYGADTLRLYEMFLGPIEQSKPWDTNGIEGTSRFLKKFWNLFHTDSRNQESADQELGISISEEAPTKAELKILHATLKKVEEDIEKLSFNTSVSQFMIACNALHELKCSKRAILEPLTIALAPFAPFIAEEIWQALGHATSITLAPWPKWDGQYLVEDSFNYPISFNGKTRMLLEFPATLDAKTIEAQVLANAEVQERLEGKAPKKVIVVPKRIVNIVV